MKRFLIKIYFCQKEFIPKFVNRLNLFFQHLLTYCSCNGYYNNALSAIGDFGEEGGVRGSASPPKDEGALKKWLDKLANTLKRLAGKTVEALPAIVGSIVGATLSFLSKAVGFVGEHAFLLQDLLVYG